MLQCRINGFNIAEYDQLELTELLEELRNINDPVGESIALQVIPHIKQLVELGLGFLSLARKMSTLSGGEGQRVKIAHQVLDLTIDEALKYFKSPDMIKQMNTLKDVGLDYLTLGQTTSSLSGGEGQRLVNQGNSVIIIEHNIDFIAASDWIIELGPGGGKDGGQIIFEGTPEEMLTPETLTAKWLKNGVCDE